MNAGGASDRPLLIVQPAVLYLAALVGVLALGVGAVLPVHVPAAIRAAAAAVVAAATLVWVWGALTMRRARTAIFPVHPATTIVDYGPFALTRNPLYCALAVSLCALAVWLGTLAGALLVLPYQLAMHRFVVLPEEAYLHAKFGARYATYCAHVRRWI